MKFANFKAKLVKAIPIVLTILLVASIACSATLSIIVSNVNDSIVDAPVVNFNAKNVIVMIGDGMGVNHIAAGAARKGTPLYMESLPEQGLVNTYSLFGNTTDSAAAATAMSTGVKVSNGTLAKQYFSKLETLTEYAESLNKATGIIATESLNGATPAGFSSHAAVRSQTATIFKNQLKSDVDLYMGAGKEFYDEETDELADAGYSYFTSRADWDLNADKVWSAFDEINTDIDATTDTAPALREMTLFALNYLQACNPNGFFLMVEGSHIDKKSHSNEMEAMLAELLAFDACVQTVVEWAQSDGDTLVLVTADHETGDLQYNGETSEQLNDAMFHSGSHTNSQVNYFVYYKEDITLPEVIDNTHIALIAREAMRN